MKFTKWHPPVHRLVPVVRSVKALFFSSRIDSPIGPCHNGRDLAAFSFAVGNTESKASETTEAGARLPFQQFSVKRNSPNRTMHHYCRNNWLQYGADQSPELLSTNFTGRHQLIARMDKPPVYAGNLLSHVAAGKRSIQE